MTSPLPPFTPIANGAQLSVQMSQAGQLAVCVVGGYFTEPDTLTQAEADRWLGAWFGAFKQYMSSEVTCTGAVARDLRTQGGTVIECGAPTSPQGVGASPLALGAASALIKWSTASGGRRGRGRSFIPGVQESQTDTNGRTLTSAGAAAWLQGVTSYLGLMEPADGVITPAVISRSDGVARQISAGSVASVIAIQRRRMR